jgi:hypothetical protein
MAVRRVDEQFRFGQGSFDLDREIHILRNLVGVERADYSADDIAVLADAALEPAANKAAVVFRLVPLRLREFRVLLGGFGRADGIAVALLEIIPSPLLVLVFLIRLVVADGDFNRIIPSR